jgi:hypothetical protein
MSVDIRWTILALGLLLVATACGDDGDGDDNGGGSEPSPPAATLAALCGDSPLSPPSTDNAFANPSFEDGTDPWCSLKPPPFVLSQDVAHSGKASAYEPLRAGESEGCPPEAPECPDNYKISYLLQEISLHELPEVISGYYRVENWEKGTEKQYLQFVVIVWRAANAPIDAANHQIRYLLSGIDSPPFQIGNAKFVFLSRDEPPVGEWVRFERNLREDFEKFWGSVPRDFDSIRVLFEVRYDDKQIGEGPVAADVYYDDLYLGPAPSP